MDFWEFMLARKMAGGGKGVDVGIYIVWLGDTNDKDTFIFMDLLPMYKVSEAVFSYDELMGTNLGYARDRNLSTQEVTVEQDALLGGEGWTAIAIDTMPYVISAVKGKHTYGSFTIDVPSDGTYFMLLNGNDGLYMQATSLRKAIIA